jgi:hypothetical protein
MGKIPLFHAGPEKLANGSFMVGTLFYSGILALVLTVGGVAGVVQKIAFLFA